MVVLLAQIQFRFWLRLNWVLSKQSLNSILFLEIISIGAAPYDNRVQWLEETRKVGTVIRMVLNPIAEIFHDNIRDYDYGLNLGIFQILWVLFYELAENYCQIMFGKIFYRFDSHINFPHSDEECKACTTKHDGSICHFPFYWNNNRYTSCIQQKLSDPWCPTEVSIKKNRINDLNQYFS